MGKKQGYIVYGFLENPGEVYSYFPSRGKNIQEKRKREMKRKEKEKRKEEKREKEKEINGKINLKKGGKGRKTMLKEEETY